MKTTIDIPDALFNQARAHAKSRGLTMRAMIETGLRLALARSKPATAQFKLQDFSFGADTPVTDLTEFSDPGTWRDLGNPQWGVAEPGGELQRKDSTKRVP